ncbi:putative heavy-metal chelation protein [Kribbella antiqua]|uniref:Putative heavy-metal chelation protein n=1 Tax=Kribbella antiqua TaxID=2512217 RepID=A0A4R2IUV9_9ACTN|nr:putative heavy-metal chelation protein [Kribbella antiqua]
MTASVAELTSSVLAGSLGPAPSSFDVTSAFWLHHTTRLPGADVTYRNYYVLLRVGEVFGACSFESGELDPSYCADTSGLTLDDVLRSDAALPVKIAALDAYLAAVEPHHVSALAEEVVLPAGTPDVRARARDAAVAGLLEVAPGSKVALIGVVNPLVEAITARGGVCLPCDFNLRETASGLPVSRDMTAVVDAADAVVATGMTLSNGSFDVLLDRCRQQEKPLVVYAQTGSAVIRSFLGSGVTALSAEPFPFSQFSSRPSSLYRYHSRTDK